tara:strand:- start:891 stop:1130 length:240 start_codon:yes stop_codon:yes gene_type:complete
MKISIQNEKQEVSVYETDDINDPKIKLESDAIIRTVSVVDIIIKALAVANNVYRDSLGNTLAQCEEARVEEEVEVVESK